MWIDRMPVNIKFVLTFGCMIIIIIDENAFSID